MRNCETPDNLVELLDGVVAAAAGTAFYAPFLAGRPKISTLADFGGIPTTPLWRYRRQRLPDVVPETSRVEYIVGPYKGQSPTAVPVVEGPDEAEVSHRLFTDAVGECVPLRGLRTCAIVTSSEKRAFAAEIATMLIRSGVPSHVFIDYGNQRTYQRLHLVAPELLVVLSDRLAEAMLPGSIELCVTFRRSHRMGRLRQLDVYVVDELGFLGHSTDCETYTVNASAYYFERSANGNLVVTSLYSRIQPKLRLETADRVNLLGSHTLEFVELSAVASTSDKR